MTNIRKKSANELSSDTVNTYYNFLQYMRISKTQSDLELFEIKHQVLKYEKTSCQQMGATYLAISLSNLIDMIDRFTDLSLD